MDGILKPKVRRITRRNKMKKSTIKLTFTLCLFCSASSLAMHPADDDEIQYAVTTVLQENNGMPARIRVSKAQPGAVVPDSLDTDVEQTQFLRYNRLLPHQAVLDALDPKQAIPAATNLGHTSKIFLLTFRDEGVRKSCEWTDNRPAKTFPHQGRWFSDPDTSVTMRTLKFSYRENEREHWFSPEPPIIKDLAVPPPAGPARIVGSFRFDGRVLQEETRGIAPGGGAVAINWKSIPDHEGYHTRLAIPFAIPGHPFEGGLQPLVSDYQTVGKTINPQIDANRLIYVSGNIIYWPKVTHELCERDRGGGRRERVGFTVISTKDTHKAELIAGGLQAAHQIPDGIYRLKSVRKVLIPGARPTYEETWEELGVESMMYPDRARNTFIMAVPERLASLPGIGTRNFQIDTGAGLIAQMQAKIERIDRNIQSIASQHPDANSILVAGYAGAGKSSLINLLLGRVDNLRVQRVRGGLRLGAHQEHAPIGHGGRRGTAEPKGFWFPDFDPDADHNKAVWDLVGLGDPAGDDIVNAFNLKRLFESIGDGNVKITLVAEQAKVAGRDGDGGFLDLLNDISAVFPDFNELKRSVSSLVVSKYDGTIDNFVEILEDVLEEQREDDARVQRGEQREVTELSANARALVQYFIDEEQRQAGSRIIPFPGLTPGMRDGELYPAGGQVRNAVLSAIQNTDGVAKPDVNPLRILRNATEAAVLANRINSSVASYIETKGTDSLFRLARSKVFENSEPVGELKRKLGEIKDKLTQIRDLSTSSRHFLTQLSDLFGGTGFLDSAPLETGIAALSFLREVSPNIQERFAEEWAPKLTYAIEALGEFVKEVPIDGVDLRGVIVGASDINRYFRAHPNATSLSVYATHAFIMDEEVDRSGQGTSIKLIAPYWKILGPYAFNLTGKAGDTGARGGDGVNGQGATEPTNGGDGGPGEPGKPGGNFFGLEFMHSDIESFSVVSNGGPGGNGGKGGKGGRGRDRFGNLQEIPSTRSGAIKQYPYSCPMIDCNVGIREGRMTATTLELVRGVSQTVKDWIGSNWHDQISVWMHTATYATPGESGKNGGKGGQRGLGGKPGHVLLVGADDWRNDNPADGAPGVAGAGGDVGQGGIISKRRAWVGCSQEEHAHRDLENVWEGGSYDEGNAVPGITPADLSAQTPTDPSDAANLDRSLDAYRDFYRDQTTNPNLFPWVQRFPGLFE